MSRPLFKRGESRKFQLRADESASANLMRACINASAYVLRRKHLPLFGEDYDDLLMGMAVFAAEKFIRKRVLGHKYNRRFTFFQNVYSEVWGSCTWYITKFMKRWNGERLMTDDEAEYLRESLRDTGRGLLSYSGRNAGEPCLDDEIDELRNFLEGNRI